MAAAIPFSVARCGCRPLSPALSRLRRLAHSSCAERVQAQVVVLWDLDNVQPRTSARSDVQDLTAPLRAAAQALGAAHPNNIGIAFANERAFKWVSEDEQQRRRSAQVNPELAMSKWSPSENSSGWDDATGALCCGVCGVKCRDHAALQLHYRRLHEREKRKLLSAHRPRKGKLNARERKRLAKYKAAEVGVRTSPTSNDLRRVVRECGFQVREVPMAPNAADDAIMRQAFGFLEQARAATRSATAAATRSATAAAASAAAPVSPSTLVLASGDGVARAATRSAAAAAAAAPPVAAPVVPPAALVLVSGDGDLVPPLKAAAKAGVRTLVCHLRLQKAASRLVAAADLVMEMEDRRLRANTERGNGMRARILADDGWAAVAGAPPPGGFVTDEGDK